MKKVMAMIAAITITMSLTGCAEFLEAAKPLAEEADKAMEVIKDDLDKASEKLDNGENVSWQDFDFIMGNDGLREGMENFDKTKDVLMQIVDENAGAIPFNESATAKLDRNALIGSGVVVTCLSVGPNADVEQGNEASTDDNNFCMFMYNTVDEVSYIYGKNVPESTEGISEEDLKNSDTLPFIVNITRIGADWYVDTMGEMATDVDFDKIVAALNRYEEYVAFPSEETYRSGGLYNVLNMATASQDNGVTTDIFARSDEDNDYIAFMYKENNLVSIMDMSDGYVFALSETTKQ